MYILSKEKVFSNLNIINLENISEESNIYKKIFDDLNDINNVFNSLFKNCKSIILNIDCDNLENYRFDESQDLYYIFENKYLNNEDLGIPYENIININPISINYCCKYDLNADLSNDILGNSDIATVEIFSNFISCHLLVKYNELDFFIRNKVEIFYVEDNIPIWIKYLIVSFKAYKSSQYQLAFSLGYIAFDSFITLVNREYNHGNKRHLDYYKKMNEIDKLLNDKCWCKLFDGYHKVRNKLLHGSEIKFNDIEIDNIYYERFIFDFCSLMFNIYDL